MLSNPFNRTVRMRDGFPVLPGGFPLFGHLPAVYRGLPEAAAEGYKLGPIVWVDVGFGQSMLMCTGPESLEILKNKAFDSSHMKEISPLVAGESMLGQNGPPHRHTRSAMNAPFLPRGLAAGNILRTSAELLTKLGRRWAEEKKARALPDVQAVALEIIFRMLGIAVDDIEEWRKNYRDLVLANLGIKLRFPGSPAVRSERAQLWINARFREIIAAARRSPDTTTLVGALANAKDDDGQPLTDTELVDNMRLLVLGGHETVSSLMAWIILRLAHHKDAWDALVLEARAFGRTPETPDEARALPVAEAVFRETIRMHPPFGVMTRKSIAPFELHGKAIPLGVVVSVYLRGIAYDESLFDRPLEYRLSRWLEKKSPPSPLEISQFGAGPHFCLGYHLAWLEAVQFAVAVALAASEKGLRPHLRRAADLAPIYVPTEHPSPKVVVDFR